MDSIFEHYKRTGYLHHAHIIEGVHTEIVPSLLSAIERHMGIIGQGNPDLTVLEYRSFGIDESRELSTRQSRAGFADSWKGTPSRKIFVISAQSFTREAQNALLKTFEEPTAGTHFFIIVPRLAIILPTLKSRVIMVEGSQTSLNTSINIADDALALAEKFLDSTLEQRFAMIKKLTEIKKGEVVDREKIRRILDHIERILYTRTAGVQCGGKASTFMESIFREIFQTKIYLADRGSSPKMLLEHLAIVVSAK